MRSRRLEAVLILTLCTLSAAPGCQQTPRPADQGVLPTRLLTPSQPGSGEPNIAVTPDGAFLLSWLEPAGEGVHALRHSRRPAGGEWGAPGTVASGNDWFVNWADFPSLAAFPDGTLAAHWLRKSGAGTYAYDVRLALSRDGGATWSESLVPHRDGTQTEHGFVSMAATAPDRLGLIWLDGRHMVADGWEIHGCPVNGPSIAARGSRVAVAWFTAPDEKGRVSVVLSDDDGETWGAPVRVDDGEPIGRVDVVLLAGGEALVSWLEQADDGAQLMARRVATNGPPGPAWSIADSGSSRSSGVPRMAISGREVVFAWRGRADPPQIRTAVLELP